jgi:hypothetical protein
MQTRRRLEAVNKRLRNAEVKEAKAFDRFQDKLSPTALRAWQQKILAALGEAGLAPPFPEGLWGRPIEERRAYLAELTESIGKHGPETRPVIRSCWKTFRESQVR